MLTKKEFLKDLDLIKKDDADFRTRHDILDTEKYWSTIADRSFKNKKDASEWFDENKEAL